MRTEESTSGSSSGSSTSSPEPPVNFELRDMSPNSKPKIMPISTEKVPIDCLDGLTAKEKEGLYGDDYLISINEHQKKGLRNKKEVLYVTEDTRRERSKSGHSTGTWVCGTIGALVLCAAIIVAVLVAVGELDMSSMNPFSTKRDRSIDISKPNVGAVQQSGINFNSIGNNDLEKINESDLLGSKELFPLGYVKHAFEGELRIKNHGWDQRLTNKSSAIFKELSNDLEERLYDIVIPEKSYLNNQAEFYVTILEFIPGSVIVRYRISWIPDDQYVPEMLISRENVLNRLNLSFENNDVILSNSENLPRVLEIEEGSVSLNYIPDACSRMNCEHRCIYEHQYNYFACACPENFYLNIDKISCSTKQEEGITIEKKFDQRLDDSSSSTTYPITVAPSTSARSVDVNVQSVTSEVLQTTKATSTEQNVFSTPSVTSVTKEPEVQEIPIVFTTEVESISSNSSSVNVVAKNETTITTASAILDSSNSAIVGSETTSTTINPEILLGKILTSSIAKVKDNDRVEDVLGTSSVKFTTEPVKVYIYEEEVTTPSSRSFLLTLIGDNKDFVKSPKTPSSALLENDIDFDGSSDNASKFNIPSTTVTSIASTRDNTGSMWKDENSTHRDAINDSSIETEDDAKSASKGINLNAAETTTVGFEIISTSTQDEGLTLNESGEDQNSLEGSGFESEPKGIIKVLEDTRDTVGDQLSTFTDNERPELTTNEGAISSFSVTTEKISSVTSFLVPSQNFETHSSQVESNIRDTKEERPEVAQSDVTTISKEDTTSSTKSVIDLLQNATESSDGIIQAEIAIELSSEPQSRSNILETTTQSTTNLFVSLDDSATVNITIPLIDEHANADELEKKLREILNNVSDQLDLGDDEATTIATSSQDARGDAKISKGDTKKEVSSAPADVGEVTASQKSSTESSNGTPRKLELFNNNNNNNKIIQSENIEDGENYF